MTDRRVVFLPVAYEWSTHARFDHPFWTFPGASSSLYDWHGCLCPIVLSGFLTTRGPQTALLSATALALLLLGSLVVYARAARLRAVEAAALRSARGARYGELSRCAGDLARTTQEHPAP